MATLTVRNLEDDVVRRLRVRAAEHGRSAEAEHREILRAALADDDRLAARQQAAERLADFRRRTGGRGSAAATELLAESRAGRLRELAGDGHGGENGA
jgi:antitoxin FitA